MNDDADQWSLSAYFAWLREYVRKSIRPAPQDLPGVIQAAADFDLGWEIDSDADYDILFDHAKAHFSAIEVGRRVLEEKAEKMIWLNVSLCGAILAAFRMNSIERWQSILPLGGFLVAIVAASFARRTLEWNIPADPWLLYSRWTQTKEHARAYLAGSYGLAGFICRRQLEWRSIWLNRAMWSTIFGIATLLLLMF